MKRSLIALFALLVAVSLTAATEQTQQQQPQPQQQQAQQAQPATGETVSAQTTTAPAATDSPLVAAAKKSNRAGKKRIVITNESLKNSTGHITTTSNQADINVPTPEKGIEQTMYETRQKEKERAAERAKADQKAAEAKQQRMARTAAASEDSAGYDEDPAIVEGALTEAASNMQSQQAQPASTTTATDKKQ